MPHRVDCEFYLKEHLHHHLHSYGVAGFYGIEEHVDAHWFECIGVDVDTSSLYKANGRCQWRENERGWEQKLPDCPESGAQECTPPDPREDLDQLFSAIPSRVTDDLGALPDVLNVSNFYLWQMVTTVNMNIDTGVSGLFYRYRVVLFSPSYLCDKLVAVYRSLTTTTSAGLH